MSALALTPNVQNLPGFGSDPFWLILIKVVLVFAFLVVMTLFSIVFERKVVGRMQNRIGPNRTGPWGTLQSLADGVKLAFKEEIIPLLADKPVYFLAPILSAVPAFVAFCVVPFGPRVSMFGHSTALQLTDLPVGVLVAFACSSLGVYGIVLSGWASGSTYPLLGGLRSAAQMISYEVAMGLSIASVFIYSGTMSTSGIVSAQNHRWFLTSVLIVPFAIYCIAVVGETNRAPFDLAEAESELVGGFHTEYSSFKFAMFFLAEYINMVTVSALATTMFLGGWHSPWFIHAWWTGSNDGWWPVLWFVIKVVAIIFVFIWLRGTLPRMRYDQFMHLGWKVLIPINLVWILVVMTVHVMGPRLPWWQLTLLIGIPAVVAALIGATAYDAMIRRKDIAAAEEEEAEARMTPTFPIPPMNLVVPKTPKVAAASRARAALPTAGSSGGPGSVLTTTGEPAKEEDTDA